MSWGRGVFGQGLLVLFSILLMAGCGKRPEPVKPEPPVKLEEVYTSRKNDKGYIASLMTNQQQQVKEAHALVALSRQMTQCVTRVRATLPAEAADEVLVKTLAADAEWVALEEQSQKLKMAADLTLQQAKDMMRLRMQEEMRAQQAVAEGKATAKDGLPDPKTTGKK